ncbi:MAG TPA: helix-hairpin-helix domain-containing protein, partial [Candidatus Deferrimicrobium sp.]|nr:helix-hairpin-helix domain-containing protein [Candidatus Deferrimicrobium sp.]
SARTPPDGSITNAGISAMLVEIADLLDIKGESAFKVGAYRRAAESVARSPLDVAAEVRAGRPLELRGVGPSITERLGELVASGRIAYLDTLREDVPPTLRDLLAIPGVGPRTIGEAWRELGIATLGGFEAAARDGRLREVRGLGARSEARILEAIAEAARGPARRMLIWEARALAGRVVELVEALPGVRSATVCGSLRRGCETVGDIDVLVETEQPEGVLAALAATPALEPGPVDERPAGHLRLSLRLPGGPALDVMTTPPGAAGSYLMHFTGSAAHNVALRHRARRQGWSLSEHGLLAITGGDTDPGRGATTLELSRPGAAGLRTFASEAELYACLGLDDIPPELREGQGEIEAAETGSLPRLVRLEDLRGDCHSHSDWSDGREPLEVMVESARMAGRRYQVLTDHSVSLGIANGLSAARVEQQRRVIAELNERFARQLAAGELPAGAHPDGFQLLHGCELEITADGRLDYDDALLARFDVVVASLHVGRRQPRGQLMARYELAMRSPHVDIISHPSGRKIGQRPDLDLDWEALFRAAAETGTLLEINGSEERLDLSAERIRAAREAGCGFVISSDAHERSEWRNLDFGVAMARRGWLEADRVANSLPLEEFLALMDDKPHRLPA